MTQIQEEIEKALIQLSEKNLITEANIAKKIRDNNKLSGKNKAGLAFQDIEEVLFLVEEENNIHFEMHLNSANDILLKSAQKSSALDPDARKRRQACEKSMEILTSADIKAAQNGQTSFSAKAHKKRTEKKRLNINQNFEDWD